VPSLKKDQVLIKVEAASLNPADSKVQRGLLRPFVPRFPFIPGIYSFEPQTRVIKQKLIYLYTMR
jgi:hypothetical protein